MKLSPMMKQYMAIKEKYQDCVIFFRLGDFYEMFFDDAIEVSRVLELTLTSRNCGLAEKAPMCGVPFHAADTYISRLVEKGYKIAVCEQMEDPAEAKGIVERDVIKIVTPGTILSMDGKNENRNNYLASFFADRRGLGLSYVDVSTGELYVTWLHNRDNAMEDMLNEMIRLGITEVIYNDNLVNLWNPNEIGKQTGAYLTCKPDSYFSKDGALATILSHFNVNTIEAIGLGNIDQAIMSLGGLLTYLLETQRHSMEHITQLKTYALDGNMILDKATLSNLELTETIYDKTESGSLIHVLDKTVTAHGSRLMKQWVREPLNRPEPINRRLNGVSELVNNNLMLNDVREMMRGIYDFQRLTGKVASGTINGRDLVALKRSIGILPDVSAIMMSAKADILRAISNDIHDFSSLYAMIDDAILEEPPISLKEGGFIRSGYSHELDELKHSIKDGKTWIANLEATEREKTGIKNLKVGFNKVFGYYIEVTKLNAPKVPEEYIRKQTLVNNERYITPKMKEVESVVLNGESKINKLENELFLKLKQQIIPYIKSLQETAIALATLDVIASLAYVAINNGYVMPTVDNSMVIQIDNGRHPVIEVMDGGNLFVPNDVYLDDEDASMAIITGPNMAGKSTYMRQTALIVLMAQMGSFVPCDSARIGVVDRIFTRIGASDNLSQGQSTFFVEMNELAYILASASCRSLIILDEIGRGTSTYDGMSIAYATVNYLCNQKFRVRTMFATHYHEITNLEEDLKGVVNLNVDVLENMGDIVFLHKIVSGPASQSYGIHVAKLAGVPKVLLEDAAMQLSNLERQGISVKNSRMEEEKDGPSSFAGGKYIMEQPIVEKLRNLVLDDIKPSEAYKILEDLKEMINDDSIIR